MISLSVSVQQAENEPDSILQPLSLTWEHRLYMLQLGSAELHKKMEKMCLKLMDMEKNLKLGSFETVLAASGRQMLINIWAYELRVWGGEGVSQNGTVRSGWSIFAVCVFLKKFSD